MWRITFWLVILSVLFVSEIPGQQPQAKQKSEFPLEADIRLLDTSTIRAAIVQEKIDIVTKYGKLTVPTKDIVSIDMGVDVPSDVQKNVAQLIEFLDSENYKARELALRDLIELGPHAYPQLCCAVKSEKPEVAKRASMALEKIKAKHPAANLRLRDFDIVTTTTFPIFGKVTPPTLKVKNDTFGAVDLKLTQVRVIRWVTASLAEADIVVDAGSYGSVPNKWLETSVDARSGVRLVIVATGTVDLWPQGPNYSSTPNGYNANGPSPPGTQFKSGTLLGRVGPEGPVFMIGDQFDGIMTRDGKLYLHIVPSPWNNPSSGSYQVKIKARDEFGE
ncbi:MAG TPA: hypothetical protein VE988_23075 [Gemmataceae bacterium]|nr:hypothetical protein [Gemmataceae bacterium]